MARTTKKLGIEHDDLYTMVTPEMAEDFLNRNTHNRPLRPGLVERIARDIKGGRWQKNGQTATIDWNDAIHDGQHRFFAIVEAGIAVPMILLTGLDPATVMTVDSGASRSYGDFQKLSADSEGQPLKNVTAYSAALRLIYWYENKWPGVRITSGRDGTATHHELHEIALRYPSLSDAIDYVQARNHPTRNVVNPTSLAFVYAMGRIEHPVEADHWLQTIWSGEGNANDPAITLRKRLTATRLSGHKLDRSTEICFMIKSWNAFAQGNTMATLRWAHDEPMPAIYGTKQYTGKRAGATALLALDVPEQVKSRIGRRKKSR